MSVDLALIALIIAAGTNLFSYWNADKLVLSMHSAQEVDEHSAPELVAIVRELAQRAGLPMPRVYLMDSPQPNAFATGRNPQRAAVCATTGLLNTLSRDEIAGVIGHELAHVRNHDTLTMTITATIAGAISMLAQFNMFFRGGGRGIVGSVLMDLAYNERNIEKVVALARDADQLFIEAPFLDADANIAREAGDIAKRACVARLIPFHFSARYRERADELTSEAETTNAAAE